MAAYDIQPFASTHPAIDALFTREFAQRQADREAAARAAAGSIARAQIGAQSQLAQEQLEEARANQDYNRLFREREFEARQDAEKVRQSQIDRQLKLYEADPEKIRISSVNAAAQAAAARYKAAYDSALETNLAAQKEADRKSMWFNGLWPGSMKELEDTWADPNNPKRLKVETDTYNSVLRKLITDKDKDLQLVIPDPKTKTFRPAQLDASGNLVIPTNNPAALGVTTNAVPTPVGVLPEDQSITVRDLPAPTTSSSGVGDMFKAVMVGAMPTVFGATATPTTTTTGAPAAPATPSVEYLSPGVRAVRHAAGPNRDVLLLPEDSAIIVRELPMVQGGDRQKAIAYQVMVDQFVKAGRGRYVPRVGAATSPLTIP